MAMMTFVHANELRNEIRVISQIQSADMEINIRPNAELIDNTWSMTVTEKTWEASPILEGHFVYCPYSEWGGIVTYLKHSTSDGTVVLQGPTFRGLLYQKRLIPPDGEAYLTVDDVDANAAITAAVGGRYGNLVHVSDAVCGKSITASWRYQALATGLQNTLRQNRLRLNVLYDPVRMAIVLDAQTVTDLTSVLEISQDYGVNFTSSAGNVELANHCLALGQGELENRTVVNVYRIGTNYYLNRPLGLSEADIRTVILDYPNAETTDELVRSATERLREMAPEYSVSIDELSADVSAELGDIISVRDRLTGMNAESEITRKILTIQDGTIKIDTKVG